MKTDIFYSFLHHRHRIPAEILRAFACTISACSVLCCSACSRTLDPPEPAVKQVFAMDTVMNLQAYGPGAQDAVDDLEQQIYELDARLDRTSASSLTTAINRSQGQPVPIDETLQALLEASLEAYDVTGGIFDITVAPLADLWGFTTDSFQVPSRSAIEQTLPRIGMQHVHPGSQTVSVDPGTELDFGGIAKGYTDELALQVFSDFQVRHGLANLGGDLAAVGGHPDGSPWKIGIQDPAFPDDQNRIVGVLSLKDAFVLTSGNYERYFEEDGVLYHHIIDPRTGSPASNGLSSVTIITEPAPGNGMLADALSTALFVMGKDDAVRFWQESALPFELILITDQGEVLITSGLRDRFTLTDDAASSLQVVSKPESGPPQEPSAP